MDRGRHALRRALARRDDESVWRADDPARTVRAGGTRAAGDAGGSAVGRVALEEPNLSELGLPMAPTRCYWSTLRPGARSDRVELMSFAQANRHCRPDYSTPHSWSTVAAADSMFKMIRRASGVAARRLPAYATKRRVIEGTVASRFFPAPQRWCGYAREPLNWLMKVETPITRRDLSHAGAATGSGGRPRRGRDRARRQTKGGLTLWSQPAWPAPWPLGAGVRQPDRIVPALEISCSTVPSARGLQQRVGRSNCAGISARWDRGAGL